MKADSQQCGKSHMLKGDCTANHGFDKKSGQRGSAARSLNPSPRAKEPPGLTQASLKLRKEKVETTQAIRNCIDSFTAHPLNFYPLADDTITICQAMFFQDRKNRHNS